MRVKERNAKRNSTVRRIESNEEIRARFEKDAHDRERIEIRSIVDRYNDWISKNSIIQLM
jgi:hypothetical protein